eukprot:29758-Rhodomonas_salina.1
MHTRNGAHFVFRCPFRVPYTSSHFISCSIHKRPRALGCEVVCESPESLVPESLVLLFFNLLVVVYPNLEYKAMRAETGCGAAARKTRTRQRGRKSRLVPRELRVERGRGGEER